MKYFDDYIAKKVFELKLIKTQLTVYTIIIIILIALTLGLVVKCFNNEIYKITLQEEKESLERIVESQSSMIADLEENCRELSKEMNTNEGD